MSRATGIKSTRRTGRVKAALATAQGGDGRTPATDYNCGPATTTGWGWRAEHGLDRVSAFNATAHALNGSLLQPVLGLLDVGQGAVVGLASERASLEEAQTVGDDGQQHFMGDAIDADIGDGAVLEVKGDVGGRVVALTRPGAWILGEVKACHVIGMIGAAAPGLIQHRNRQGVIGRVDLVIVDRSHVISKAARTRAACGVWSLEPVGLIRSQDNLAHVDGYPKGSADDDKREKAQSDFHGSLSSNEVVKARSNASHNISSNSDEAKGHGEDLAEGVHSALHLGGLALGLGKLGQSDCAVDVVEGQCQPFGLRKLDQLAGHIWGHTLLIRLVERDVALRNADASAQLGLADAQLVADQLDLVHAHIISATVSSVNSGAFCVNTSRTNTLWR